jgi:hypothetical protein
VFGGSERSTVEMKLGPGDAWMTMRMERREDPAYVRVKASESSETPPPGRPMREPMLSGHIWVGRLPADPPSGLWLIQVRTTDMYGQRYTAQRSILVRGG